MKKSIFVAMLLVSLLVVFGCSKPAAPQAAATGPVNDRSNQLYIEVSALSSID